MPQATYLHMQWHCVTDRTRFQPTYTGSEPVAMQLYAAPVCDIMVSAPVMHVLIYQPARDGRLSWPN